MIYLIQEIWVDPMENHNAHGYTVIGYVDTKEEAITFCLKGRVYTQKDCWSLFCPAPQYRYEVVGRL